MDYSLPGSSVRETLQAGIRERVAISFSRGSSWPRDRIQISHATGRLFTDWATRVQNKTRNHALKYLYSCVCYGASPGGSVVKNLPSNASDAYSIPGPGRPPGRGHGNPLQYSCLENPVDRKACQATVHRVTKSWTWLKQLITQTHVLYLN